MRFGDYGAQSLEEAMEVFAKDAGYASWQAMTDQAIEVAGAGNIEIREVSPLDSRDVGPNIAPDQTPKDIAE